MDLQHLKYRAWDGETMHYFTINEVREGTIKTGNSWQDLKSFEAVMVLVGYLEGSEIYEGDILASANAPRGETLVIQQRTTKDWIGYPTLLNAVLLGNIHENPEIPRY